jgi:hypothetical protein
MELFLRFAVAMDFLAIAVLDREMHRLIGLATWRLARLTDDDATAWARDASARAELLRAHAARPL